MRDSIPRRLMRELLARWTLAGIRQVIVEGPSDHRFMKLLQHELHCDRRLGNLDIYSVDIVEVPTSLLDMHGLSGSGAKQRVVAFSREVRARGAQSGFRGVVDRDFDRFLALDFSGETVVYTDYSCMLIYSRTPQTLHRILIQFKCELSVITAEGASELWISISSACKDVAALRLASLRQPDLGITVHHSDKCLRIVNCKPELDWQKYSMQANTKKHSFEQVMTLVEEVRGEIEREDPLDVINSHDLVWVLTYSIKALTKHSRHQISEEIIESSLAALGLMRSELSAMPMLAALADWS